MDDSLQSTLGALAWKICAAGRVPVAVNERERLTLVPAIETGVLVDGEAGLRFASDSVLVDAAVRHVLREQSEQLLGTPLACFEQLHEIWCTEITKQPHVSAHVLAALHNGNKLDAFESARQAIEAGANVFDVLHVMEHAVILFNHAFADHIYRFFVGHYENVKNDLAGNILYVRLPPWLAQHPEIPAALQRMHETNPREQSAGVYATALHAMIIYEFTEGFAVALLAARNSAPAISGPALQVLGLADYQTGKRDGALADVVQLCREVVQRPGHPNAATAVRTLGRLVTLSETPIVELLFEAAKSEAPEAQYSVSEILFQGHKTLVDREWFWPLLLCLSPTRAQYKRILHNLDLIFMGWVRDSAWRLRVLDFFNAWILKQQYDDLRAGALVERFDATFHALAGDSALPNRALTQWLLADDDRFPVAAQTVVSRARLHDAPVALDQTLVDGLEQHEIRFLLRRILGYIVGEEAQLQLTFSLLHVRDAPQRTLPWVRTVLAEEIGPDYPDATIQFLAQQAESASLSEVRDLCGEVTKSIQVNLDALNALPRLREYAPSSLKVRRLAKERRKEMNKAMEAASQKSILRQLATNVVLKAGRRSYQKIGGKYTGPTELTSFSHSITIPRSEIGDPVGAAIKRFSFRNAKKGEP